MVVVVPSQPSLWQSAKRHLAKFETRQIHLVAVTTTGARAFISAEYTDEADKQVHACAVGDPCWRGAGAPCGECARASV